MNKQLRQIIDIFNDNKITYWIDSGTLLGLMREGDLLKHDNDIDIGTWAGNEEIIINKIFPIVLFQKYKIKIHYFQDKIFKIIFYKKKLKKIDINIYRENESNSFAWCPQRFNKKGGVLAFKIIKYLVEKIYIKCNIIRRIHVDKVPLNIISDIYTWWIPIRYFKKPLYKIKYNIYIPNNWEYYLEFRYKDWKTPRTRWNFKFNDGGLVDKPPNFLTSVT